MGVSRHTGGISRVDLDELDELTDVVITSPTSGQTLVFNGTEWVNASAAGGGSGTVTSVSAGVGLTATPNPVTGAGVIELADTAVSAGRYTLATIDVDAQGRIVSAADGTAGSGTVTSAGVTGTDGIGVAGSPITTAGQITLSLGNITPDNVTTGVVSAATVNVTGDVQAATGKVTASALSVTAHMTGSTASFAGLVSANAGLVANGDISTAGRLTASAATVTALLNGATASFSGIVSANAGLRATTVSASGVIGGQNLSGTNTGDQTITLTGDVSGTGTGSFAATVNPGVITNAKLANMAAFTIKSNVTSSAAAAADNTLSSVLDASVSGAIHGDILYRGNGTWTKLVAGTSGQYLMTQGASADPRWGTVAGTGTVTSVSAGAGLIAAPNPITAAGAIQLDTSAQNAWTAQQHFATATLTDASAVAWNLKSQQVAQLTRAITGTATLQDPTNMANGATYILKVTKGSASSGTLAFTSAYRWPGSTAPTLSTASGATDILTFVCIASVMYGSYTQNYSQA